MIIYHGGTIPVDTPKILKGERMLDFGKGFYTTSNKEQAERWAEIVATRRNLKERFVTEYEFDFSSANRDLTVISFDNPNEEWLDFVCLNRSGQIPPKPYDIVIGPVANDQVYTVVALYEQGVLSKEAAIIELRVRKLYNQILFHTEKSLNYCKYLRYTKIGGEQNGS